MTASAQTFEFQAETKQLLEIVIHSLYTSREIFLRELISNASDAIDRLRFEMLTRPELLSDGDKFEIRIEVDPKSRTLRISDNGIGMSRDEVIANIGTIAKSGTRELRERINEAESNNAVAEMIGQFGVGFYSCFMVADKVTLVSRRAGEEAATRWESRGEGSYVLTEAVRPERGTSITLQLKPADPEQGVEDFTDRWVLSRIVSKYSDFVSYPIILRTEREQQVKDEAEGDKKDGMTTIVVEDKVLNSMKPIWTRPQAEVTDKEYAEFFKHISHELDDPIKTICVKAEGRLEYQALLFIPRRAPYDLYYHGFQGGLRLYAKRVMVMERCEELLPRYLRFIKGVVDSTDLPLNISRQMLQKDQHITHIRKWLTKKVLDHLQELFDKEPDTYLEVWKQFGRALKEGASSDYENKEKIVSLLLFESSNDASQLTSLKDYVSRMKEGQAEIFYLTGESRSVIENSPHLESFAEKGYEVLYLSDPVDELLVQALFDFDGKRLKSVVKGEIKLAEQEETTLKQKEEEVSALLEKIQKGLEEHVKRVRLTNRLTKSPVCLVVDEHDYSPQLERLLMKGKGAGPKQRRILELNPAHRLFERIHKRFQADPEDPIIQDYAELLLGYALLAEGSELPDPVRFNSLLAESMLRGLQSEDRQ